MKLIRTRQNTVMWIVDVVLTLLAWAGLIWLLARGINAMLETHGGPRIEAPIFAALNTLQVYMWIALFNALILVTWARYQQRKGRKFAQRRAEANALSDKNLSESFKLGKGDLENCASRGCW